MDKETATYAVLIFVLFFSLFGLTYECDINRRLHNQLEEKDRLILDIQSTCHQYENEINELYNRLESDKK